MEKFYLSCFQNTRKHISASAGPCRSPEESATKRQRRHKPSFPSCGAIKHHEQHGQEGFLLSLEFWCILRTMNSCPKAAVEQGFEQDRMEYWTMRQERLTKYPGKWLAVHKGRVVTVGEDPLSIMEPALAEDGCAYTNKVGDEDKIVIRQRRVSFSYDDKYTPAPIPRMAAVLHNFPQTRSKAVTDAIPDTGADVTCLPVDDCQDPDLFRSLTMPAHPTLLVG